MPTFRAFDAWGRGFYMGKNAGQDYEATVDGSLTGGMGDNYSETTHADGTRVARVDAFSSQDGVSWIVTYDKDRVYSTFQYENAMGQLIYEITDINSQSQYYLPGPPGFFWIHQRGHAVDNRYDDTFIGNNFTDIIWGGPGHDTIIGNGGTDHTTGGGGNDVFDLGDGHDTADGGTGWDLVKLDGLRSSYTVVKNANGTVTFSGMGWNEVALNVEEIQFKGDGKKFTVAELLNPLPSEPPKPSEKEVEFPGTGKSDVLIANELDNVLEGFTGNDRLYGLDGDDILSGGMGIDYLAGGGDADTFVFDTKPHTLRNRDKIVDFNPSEDVIALDSEVFKKLARDGDDDLETREFWTNNSGKAHDKDDRVIYDKDSGILYYDADGTGRGSAVQFATIKKFTKLTWDDFQIV